MRHTVFNLIGKSVQYVARLRGGGSALPGLVIEKIDSDFVPRALSRLPRGVVIVSGTNGKTTTTKMLTELLEGQGLKVFTNRTGSNFIRGVAAAIIDASSATGKLDADIAVVELDEAHAVHFVAKVKPRYSLLLNVMRDQLDRFGEIDHTADLLHKVASSTSGTVVINRDDPRLTAKKFRDDITAKIATYGVSPELQSLFPSDDALRGSVDQSSGSPHFDDVELSSIKQSRITLKFDDKSHELDLQLVGIYNMQNAAGAVAMTRAIMGDELQTQVMLDTLSRVQPAFGRGETITIDGTPHELLLVKNPAGFRLSLASFQSSDYQFMIAINDDYADGRDMSWLWDVDFTALKKVDVVSGVRAYDMALRLQYDEVPVGNVIEDLSLGLQKFVTTDPQTPKRIYCTYTAMLALRKELSKYADVEKVL